MPESGSDAEQLRQSVRKEVTQQAAKWLVAGAIGVVTIAATGWWLYLKPKLVDIAGGVPAGIVAAFDGPRACPVGWVVFEEAAGRAIIGVGKGQGLSERRYRDEGGEERHVITIEEMPQHTHEVVQMVPDNNIDGLDSTTTHSDDHHNEKRQSGPTGGGQPLPGTPSNLNNNMPPFLALTYCMKK